MQTVSAIFKDLLGASDDAFDQRFTEFFETGEELIYQVRVPVTERAEPPGVLIYISPKPGARMPDAWAEVLDG
ncbi:MAG: hypothetical protein O3A63_20635 [Proteobacteria bacterium]|nr:hypothetical protein [Pseudomonadota bacterium]